MRNFMMPVVAAVLLIAAAPAGQTEVMDALSTIRAAALSKDVTAARALFADDLALISQSGKLYGKTEALADLGNGFETWENSDVQVRSARGLLIVTLVNSRKRPNVEAARFWLLQVWRKGGKGWQLAAQSSTRIL